MLLSKGLSQILMGIGVLVMIFAIYPTTGTSPGLSFDTASDFTHLKIEIAAARPQMMAWGIALTGIGVVIQGVLVVLTAFGDVRKRLTS